MKTQKMSLANMQGKLTRTEMKNIMAGSGSSGCDSSCNGSCTVSCGGIEYTNGNCKAGGGRCYCTIGC